MKNILLKILVTLFAISLAVSAICIIMSQNGRKTIEVNATNSQNIVTTYAKDTLQNGESCFEESELDIPEYFIKGMKYTLDNVFAYSKTNGELSKKLLTSAKISNDGAEYVSFNYRDFQVSANTSVKIKYEDGALFYETPEIPVINDAYDVSKTKYTEKYTLANYFEAEEGKTITTEVKTNSIVYKLDDKMGNITLDYINVLSFMSFGFEVTFPEGYDNFSSVDIQLIDYYNRSKVNTINISKGANDTTKIKFNNSPASAYNSTVSRVFTSTKNTLLFSQDNGAILEKNGANFKLTKDILFSSDRILLHIKFNSVRGDAGIEIKSVNSQSFPGTADSTPTLFVDNSRLGTYSPNSEIAVYKQICGDALNPFYGKDWTCKVTLVVGESRTEVYDVSGQKCLDFGSSWEFEEDSYVFKMTKPGKYLVSYSYKDQNNKTAKGNTQFPYLCVDSVAPTFTLTSNGQEYNNDTVINLELNTTFALPSVNASDDIDDTSKLLTIIGVWKPNGRVEVVNGSSYKFTLKGTYYICYEVFDTTGNYSDICFKVVVE